MPGVAALMWGIRGGGKSTFGLTLKQAQLFPITGEYDRDDFPNNISDAGLGLTDEARASIYMKLLLRAETNTQFPDQFSYVCGDWGSMSQRPEIKNFIASLDRRITICGIYFTCDPLVAYQRLLRRNEARDRDVIESFEAFSANFAIRKQTDEAAIEIFEQELHVKVLHIDTTHLPLDSKTCVLDLDDESVKNQLLEVSSFVEKVHRKRRMFFTGGRARSNSGSGAASFSPIFFPPSPQRNRPASAMSVPIHAGREYLFSPPLDGIAPRIDFSTAAAAAANAETSSLTLPATAQPYTRQRRKRIESTWSASSSATDKHAIEGKCLPPSPDCSPQARPCAAIDLESHKIKIPALIDPRFADHSAPQADSQTSSQPVAMRTRKRVRLAMTSISQEIGPSSTDFEEEQDDEHSLLTPKSVELTSYNFLTLSTSLAGRNLSSSCSDIAVAAADLDEDAGSSSPRDRYRKLGHGIL